MRPGNRDAVGRLFSGVFILALPGAAAVADGIVVDRIYDPYVQPLETEIELRSVSQFDDDVPNLQKHSLSVGRSLNDRWAAEVYIVTTKTERDGLDLDVYELELKWQITEQGEYGVDWGMVFELEREFDDDIQELSAAVIAARDFGRWTALLNAGVAYEWGSGVVDEAETDLHLQARYRYREQFEPGIEFHVGQDTAAIGPAFTGMQRLSPGRQLHWEAGIFFGLDEISADYIVKLNLEYEF